MIEADDARGFVRRDFAELGTSVFPCRSQGTPLQCGGSSSSPRAGVVFSFSSGDVDHKALPLCRPLSPLHINEAPAPQQGMVSMNNDPRILNDQPLAKSLAGLT